MIYPLPELLAPVGDEERLRSAIEYGADAVYLGADKFGMRTAAASFGGDALKSACDYAHTRGVKVYLTCNILPRNKDIDDLPAFLEYVKDSGVDALIVTDIGVMQAAKRIVPDIDIHISTQAGITNYASATAMYEMGAKRVVLARELSLDEIASFTEQCASPSAADVCYPIILPAGIQTRETALSPADGIIRLLRRNVPANTIPLSRIQQAHTL